MSYADAIAALERRSNYEATGRLTSPSLERMAALMDVMAYPHRAYPSMHVTGTVGKTTVARAAGEVLRAAGLSVGVYVSPHVTSVRERLLFDGSPITEDGFTTAWEELSPYLDLIDGKADRHLTWFEAVTALGFAWFAERSVDVAVVEVGMGGTWDATNVIDASVAVIAPVALDHTDVLGDTPEKIAREKAGIIKSGAIVYAAAQEQPVADVLRARCDEVGAEIRAEGFSFELEDARLALGGQQLAFRLEKERYREVFLPMHGEHAARDAVLGIAAARSMLGDAVLEQEVIAEALGELRMPGRMEVVQRHPLVVLDGAHNPPAARALADAMRQSFRWKRFALVIGAMADKDLGGIVGPLASMADVVVVTAAQTPRAADPEELAAFAREHAADVSIEATVPEAVARAVDAAEDDDCVLVAGSLYAVGEAREHLAVP